MAKVYYDKDANLGVIKKKTVAIIGYGAQGRAQALNLRDSGIKVIIAELKNTLNYKLAVQEGFKPTTAVEAAKCADIIHMLAQDHVQAIIYQQIKPYLKKDAAISFSHGFNIHFKQIIPSKSIDIFMVAPKGPGTLVRDMYLEKKGVPCLIAVYQDATKQAKKIALAFAKAIGGTRAGVIETTFKEETETDLFGEQAVLCGGATELVKAGFDTLTNAGYQPEIAYFECLHELKLIVDLMYKHGIQKMRYVISDTAEYGDYTRGKRIIDSKTRLEMKKILKEIQSGSFAKEWIEENKAGRKKFLAARKKAEGEKIEKVGAKLRKMMPWIK
ncbi:MAG: ketol-acid reductoisomerase [Candidatus Saelkia tenebricola]|nr:ketol-acid reductoisomerase [Candidatus Saelkia tenebricola]